MDRMGTEVFNMVKRRLYLNTRLAVQVLILPDSGPVCTTDVATQQDKSGFSESGDEEKDFASGSWHLGILGVLTSTIA